MEAMPCSFPNCSDCLKCVLLQVRVHIATVDVSDLAAVSALPDDLPEEVREVDILVNNAGEGRKVYLPNVK